jgi:KTSC domain
MNRVAVASTTLASVSYFPDRHLLELEFRNGAVYEYCDVPLHEYHELLAADSKGAYFNGHIRNCFPYRQVRGSSDSAC